MKWLGSLFRDWQMKMAFDSPQFSLPRSSSVKDLCHQSLIIKWVAMRAQKWATEFTWKKMYPAYDDNKEQTNKRNKWIDTKTNGTTNNICIGHVFNGKRFSLRWKNKQISPWCLFRVTRVTQRTSYFKNSLWLRLFSNLLATINCHWLNFQSPSGAQSFVTFQALDKSLKFLKLLCFYAAGYPQSPSCDKS